MHQRSLFLVGLLVSLMVGFGSCKESPSEGPDGQPRDPTLAQSKALEGYAEMENQMYLASTLVFDKVSDLDKLTFERSNALFKEAVAADPTNGIANCGAAITEIMTTYADPAVNDMLKKWENYSFDGRVADPAGGRVSLFRRVIPGSIDPGQVPVAVVGSNLMAIFERAVNDPPTVSQTQTIVRNNLVPRLDYAIARLEAIEAVPTFEMRISGKMQGDLNLAPVFIDLTEIYVMHAGLLAARAAAQEFLVYQFPLASFRARDVVPAIRQDNSTFFVLAADGRDRSRAVRADMLGVVTKLKSAISYLKSETDNQSDDVIKVRLGGSGEGIMTADLDSAFSYLTQAEQSLSVPRTFEFRNADSDGNTYNVTVNLQAFFDNPPANPKQQWLPPYTVDTSSTGAILWRWTQQDYESFTFPDPTFGGLFPGMTSTTLKRILYIDEEFAWRLWCYVRNDNGGFNSSTSLKVVVGTTTYFPRSADTWWYDQYSRYFNMYVTGQAGQLARFYLVNNGVETLLETSVPAIVRPKTYQDLRVDVTPAPQNLTAAFSTSQVQLNWGSYSYFRIERSVAGGAFVQIDSLYGSSYTDASVGPATSYQYRVRRMPFCDGWWNCGDFLGASIPNNISNTVAITTPAFSSSGVRNYSFVSTTATWSTSTGATAIFGGGVDDLYSSALNIGFTFPFGGTTYSTLVVESNGRLWLGSSPGTDVIRPLSGDIATAANGSIVYKLEGNPGSRVLTIEFLSMQWYYYSSTNIVNFKVRLYESNGVIEYLYGPGVNASASGSTEIGLGDAYGFLSVSSNGTSSNASRYTSISAWPGNGRLYRFAP